MGDCSSSSSSELKDLGALVLADVVSSAGREDSTVHFTCVRGPRGCRWLLLRLPRDHWPLSGRRTRAAPHDELHECTGAVTCPPAGAASLLTPARVRVGVKRATDLNCLPEATSQAVPEDGWRCAIVHKSSCAEVRWPGIAMLDQQQTDTCLTGRPRNPSPSHGQH